MAPRKLPPNNADGTGPLYNLRDVLPADKYPCRGRDINDVPATLDGAMTIITPMMNWAGETAEEYVRHWEATLITFWLTFDLFTLAQNCTHIIVKTARYNHSFRGMIVRLAIKEGISHARAIDRFYGSLVIGIFADLFADGSVTKAHEMVMTNTQLLDLLDVVGTELEQGWWDPGLDLTDENSLRALADGIDAIYVKGAYSTESKEVVVN